MSDLGYGSGLGSTAVAEEVPLSAHGATPEVMAVFLRAGTETTYAQEKVLFRQGSQPSNVYLVVSGEVGLVMRSGRRELIFEAMPGSIVGLPAIFSDKPYSLTAFARAGTRVVRLGREEFTALLRTNPALSLDLLRVLAEETHGARQAISGLCSEHR